jgi:hypothetical protein
MEMKEIPATIEQLRKWAEENALTHNPQVVISELRSMVLRKRSEVKVDKWVSKPTMARMTGKDEKEKAQKLLIEIEAYEKTEKRIKAQMKKRDAIGNHWEKMAIQYLKEESGLFTIPKKYQQKVWSKAWEYGHSNGYPEVYHYLRDLLEIFEQD